MRYYIYGPNCNASYQNISKKLDKYIEDIDEIFLADLPGVNQLVIQYAIEHKIKFQAYSNTFPLFQDEAPYAIHQLKLMQCKKALFFFSEYEPPKICIPFQLAIHMKDISEIEYEFV